VNVYSGQQKKEEEEEEEEEERYTGPHCHIVYLKDPVLLGKDIE